MGCGCQGGEEEVNKLLLDASALYPLVKKVVSDPGVVEELLGRLVLLDLTLYEACNAALMEHRRGLVKDPRRICNLVSRLSELVELVRVKGEWLPGILDTALSKGLTFYDAAYVYVAKLYNYTLVTEDRDILRACPEAVRASELLT